MTQTFRKLTQSDFQSRIARVDPFFARHGVCRVARTQRVSNPVLWTVIGFGWIYFVVTIGRRRDWLEQSLAQGSLPEHMRDWVLAGLAALIGVTAVMMVLHLARFLLRRRGQRGASGNILAGALGALMLVNAPADMLTGGAQGMGGSVGAFLTAALDSTHTPDASLDVSDIRLVSSKGN
ncbi:hypothetical protein [Litorisediminicola beolgyonensis]|uniref:Uncharacterized protein n=1 Tax=Litorisediminicola beolgyonensis TaxID=1173614 RepID=A0ABW3ZFJ1_9RHOB